MRNIKAYKSADKIILFLVKRGENDG